MITKKVKLEVGNVNKYKRRKKETIWQTKQRKSESLKELLERMTIGKTHNVNRKKERKKDSLKYEIRD